MTKSEFKAWFDGFCEGMDAAPNEKQWERIKARVAEIDDKVVSYPVYVDRYVEPYRRYWPNVPYWTVNTTDDTLPKFMSSLDAKSSVSLNPVELSVGATHAEHFDSLPAMKAAGLAEYRAMLNG